MSLVLYENGSNLSRTTVHTPESVTQSAPPSLTWASTLMRLIRLTSLPPRVGCKKFVELKRTQP
jgi:hypothetical protein